MCKRSYLLKPKEALYRIIISQRHWNASPWMCNEGCGSSWREKKPQINGFFSMLCIVGKQSIKRCHSWNCVFPIQSEGQHRCVGSSVLGARLLLGHQPAWSKPAMSDISMFPTFSVPVWKLSAAGVHLLFVMMEVSILLPSILLLLYL